MAEVGRGGAGREAAVQLRRSFPPPAPSGEAAGWGGGRRHGWGVCEAENEPWLPQMRGATSDQALRLLFSDSFVASFRWIIHAVYFQDAWDGVNYSQESC